MKKLIILPISIILLLLTIYIGLSLYITDLAYAAERKTPEETPPDYSLNYEDISFKSYSEDSIELKGWWIPGNKKDVAIVWVHGLDSERSGGEGKLEMMKEINEMGYSLLTFDLRGHGESGTAPLGLGVREKEDVYGAIEFLSNEKNIKKVGLWGISYGAVTVIDAGINVPDLDAEIVGIMADTPYFSVLELLTKEVADRTPIPKFVADILKFGIIQSGKILQGMDINDVPDSMANNNKINFPILIISCKTDERVPESHPSRVYSFSRESSEYHVFDKCEDHGEAYETNKGKYMDLFKKYFSSRF
jgi:pimeloyl-ACP methyl ester carboxylesterase